MLSVGLMSGTSMDGVDAALLETDGSENHITELGQASLSYTPEFKLLLKATEYVIRRNAGNLSAAEACYAHAIQTYLKEELRLPEAHQAQQLAALRQALPGETLSLNAVIQHSTRLHGELVKQLLQKTGQAKERIAVVGYHGQTFYHHPAAKISVVLGNGQALANDLGLTVVNDFRAQDVAAGGQGAPFAPLFHYALARRDQRIPAAIVNCGGIANLTLVQSSEENDLIAFDTGPGNGLIDRLVRQRTGGKESMDTDGQYGRRGRIHASVFQALWEKALVKEGQNYLAQLPPKALDQGDLKLISELDALSLEDACATLEAFTAETVVSSLDLIQADSPPQWILAGGGWKNPVIRQQLEERLQRRAGKNVKVLLAEDVGWNSQALEAQIFAYLAVRSLQMQPLSLPGTTGVPYPMQGGTTYLPQQEI